ncbi:hypothetical protein LAWI1_G000425 [Lachnellula willkommii]|uniref:FAD-binding FR-type domain-containing protein n=1 Tax=Lachnellula willkommii TaxID=215461 RepID=A0A559MJN4_9HELO|nr:hypothetical protein LAWI1_G000425 [Lachnellula willkommii]
MSLEMEMQWHTGEEQMHKLLRVPQMDNPTQPYLTPNATNTLMRSPLIALGTLDSKRRPWTTLWGGEAGFSRPIAQSIIGVKTTVDRIHDPLVKILLHGKAAGEVVQEKGTGRMVSGLAIDLETRRRVKLYGRMVVGTISATEEGVGEIQLVVKIEQSLAINLISKADLFFISSSNHESDMDTNHRGGSPGFVRVLSNDENGPTLIYPEYSGNRHYQTLGNLNTTPQAGLVFPDFDTGNVLYMTGTTEILVGKAATNLISHTNLAVKIKVDAVRFVSDGLAFRGQQREYSPYNPPVRYLSTERANGISPTEKIYAKLIHKNILSPTVGRFRFQIADPKKATWKPGQYVALSFQEELDIGYSHMRDDDPKSLNDDFLRTFTVSSRQPENVSEVQDQFAITIRKVGVVTDFLFKQNVRSELEVPLQGFGGDFFIQQSAGERISFLAGGVGITPLLAQAADLDLERFHLYWTIRAEDIALVVDTFENVPGLAAHSDIFVTGTLEEGSEDWKKLELSSAKLQKRRISREDVSGDPASKWYLCTGTGFRNSLIEWLGGKTVLYEDFNY